MCGYRYCVWYVLTKVSPIFSDTYTHTHTQSLDTGGTILVMILDGINSSDVKTFAYVAFALNASGAAAYSICQKPLIESGFKAIFLTACAMTSAFIPMIITVIFTICIDPSLYDDFFPKTRQLLALFYCGFGISAVGYASLSYVSFECGICSSYYSTHQQFTRSQVRESFSRCDCGKYVPNITTRIHSSYVFDIRH